MNHLSQLWFLDFWKVSGGNHRYYFRSPLLPFFRHSVQRNLQTAKRTFSIFNFNSSCLFFHVTISHQNFTIKFEQFCVLFWDFQNKKNLISDSNCLSSLPIHSNTYTFSAASPHINQNPTPLHHTITRRNQSLRNTNRLQSFHTIRGGIYHSSVSRTLSCPQSKSIDPLQDILVISLWVGDSWVPRTIPRSQVWFVFLVLGCWTAPAVMRLW